MKHAGPQALDALEPVLARIRSRHDLKEKTRGVFYLRSRAFLHFHEDPAGVFADIRPPAEKEFQRLRVVSADEQDALLAVIAAATGGD